MTEEKEEGEEQEEEKEDSQETEDDNLEEKRDMIEELDVEMSDEELREVKMEELERIVDEKEKRDRLVEMLEDEGMSRSELENASMNDLKRLKKELLQQKAEEAEEEEKEKEKMEEEAEEDLEMLMGAGKEESSTNQKDSWKDMFKFKGLKNTKKQLSSLLHGGAGSDGEEKESKDKMSEEAIEEVLESYREMESREASVKTAHIMKGFLEYKLGIEREMTYEELADFIEENRDSENLLKLSKFLRDLHKDEYTGQEYEHDHEELIDTSEQVVEAMA